MKRCSTCSSSSQSTSLLQSTGQALVRIWDFFEVYTRFAQFCWSQLLRNKYITRGCDEHKKQGLVQQPQRCATSFLPLLVPLSSHHSPGAKFILISMKSLFGFEKGGQNLNKFLILLMLYVWLGMYLFTNPAVFFNIVQRRGGVKPMLKEYRFRKGIWT